jgi:outer membrane protein
MKKLIILALMCAPMAVLAQKFGHFNSQTLMQEMPEVKAVQTEMQNIKSQYDKELETMQTELKNKYTAYMSQRDSLPVGVQQRREQEITDLQQRLQQTSQSYGEEYEKQFTEKMQPIQQKILNAIKEIGDLGGYVYIMDLTNGIPYISTTLSTDITAQLKAKLGMK